VPRHCTRLKSLRRMKLWRGLCRTLPFFTRALHDRNLRDRRYRYRGSGRTLLFRPDQRPERLLHNRFARRCLNDLRARRVTTHFMTLMLRILRMRHLATLRRGLLLN
jgi:hypothetical protein